MEDVVAVDGTVIPIRLSSRLVGRNRSKVVVVAAIATGAAVFPYTPPIGLIWGLKKGEEAVLNESIRSTAVISGKTEVAGLVPRKPNLIYHSVDKLKSDDSAKGSGLDTGNNSFRPTPIHKN
jgi:hypothetical protein